MTALLLALCFAVTLGVSGAHAATDPFPMTESFTGATFSGSDWHTGGSGTGAYLTASGTGTQTDTAGNGWLRLTDATTNQFGYVVDDTAFPSDNGILVNFDYATYGGSGADGLSFFLYDGSTPYTSFNAGPKGGALGYASCPTNGELGVTNAYVGVGFDEYGNFANLAYCGLDGTTTTKNMVSVRGSAADNYKLLTSSPTAPESLSGDRTQPRHVTVSVTPDLKLSVYIRYPDGTYQTVADGYQLPTDNVPDTLKFGFAGSTGSATNVHEIRNNSVVKPADLSTSISPNPQHTLWSDKYTWTVQVANSTDNDTTGDTVKMTSPQGTLNNVSWTCTTSDPGAACATASGTGLPDTTADLPKGTTATYTVTGQTSPGDDYASLSVDAEPTGATGELNPTDNVAELVIDTDPRPVTAPQLAVRNVNGLTGTATFTHGTYTGGDITLTDIWQECDFSDNGQAVSCTDIPGATGASYTLGSDMRDKGLRVREIITNYRASTSWSSAIYYTHPDTALAGTPPAVRSTNSVTLPAVSQTAGSAFEYQLDGGGWVTTDKFAGLADGEHTIKARAVYAGLADVTPVTYTFTVDTVAPGVPTLTAPANASATNDATPTLKADAEAGSTVEFSIDGLATVAATADADGHASVPVPTALSDGQYTVTATATDPAGNISAVSSENTFTVDTKAPDAPTFNLADGTLTNQSPVVIIITAEANASVRMLVDDIASDGFVSPAGQYRIINSRQGAQTVIVTVTDAAGNTSTAATLHYTLDTRAPAAPTLTAPVNGAALKNASPALAADSEPGARVTFALDGTDLGPVIADADGHASFTPADALSDGRHTLTATATDPAGNISAVSSENTFTVDTKTPDAPTVTAPADGSAINDATPGIQVSGEADATAHVSIDGAEAGTVTLDASGHGTFTPADDLADAKHTVTATQTDPAGNASAASEAVSFTVDTKAPDVPTVTAPADGSYTNDNTPTLKADAEPGSRVSFTVVGPGGAYGATATADSDGHASAVTPAALRDGQYTVQAEATDAAANHSAYSTANAFTVDTAKPAAPALPDTLDGGSESKPAAPSKNPAPTLDLTGEPNSTMEVYVDGDLVDTVALGADGTATYTLRLTDGDHQVTLVDRDRAGNSSDSSSTAYYSIDTAAPDAPTVTGPTDGLVSKNTAPTVTVTAEPGSDVTVEVDGHSYQATADKDGNASTKVTGPLGDGPHTVRAQATDHAGNTGDWSAVTTWTVKTSTQATLPGPAAGATATNQPTVTFTGEPGATYQVTVDGKVIATGVIDATGKGSLQVPDALADGNHVIAVTVTDVAGNEDTQTVRVTVDTTRPPAVTFAQAPAQDSSERNATFVFTGEPGTRLECSLDGAKFTMCASPLAFTGLPEGPHVLRVRSMDAAGNVSADQQYAWTVDTTRPAAPAVLGGPDAQTLGENARFAFTPEPGATLECALDGGAYAPCPPVLTLKHLKAGQHTLRVRQTDAAGNLSGDTVYRWKVTATPKTGTAKRVTALLGAATTVSDGRRAAVGCNLNAGALQSCHVTLYYHGKRIGRATEHVHGTHGRTVVHVKLSKRGRALLRRALGGLPVTAKVKARSQDGRTLRDRAKGTLYPPTVFSVPVLFNTDRFALDRLAAQTVRGIAGDIRHAKRVTCEGYTDSRGRAAHNHRLALNRARTVCQYLRALGVHARMHAMSYGEKRPAASNRTTRGRRLNRRVLVRVSY